MAYDLLPIKVMEVVKIGPALRHIVQMGLQSRVLGHYCHFGDGDHVDVQDGDEGVGNRKR